MKDRLAEYEGHKRPVWGPKWTEERVAVLAKLWGQGLEASKIARQLGGVTRNAVIGKAHRLKLVGRNPSTREKRARGTAAITAAERKACVQAELRKIQARRKAKEILATPPDPMAQVEELVVPAHERRGVLELQPNQCRWPMGDPGTPGFHFCHCPKHEVFVYCEFHARRAYAPERPRWVSSFRGPALGVRMMDGPQELLDDKAA